MQAEGSTRQFFDDAAIIVTGVKIHFRIDLRGIVAQNLFHPAGLFKEILPIQLL